MEIYRLSREKYANDLTGHGASLKGGRWNSQGIEMIYAAENRSLAMAEVAVHFSLATIPIDYVMTTIFVPLSISAESLDTKLLPSGWNKFPYSRITQEKGDAFILKGKSCIIKVPSAITTGDFNFLINPHHNDIKKIKIISVEKFPFDKRIFSNK